MVGSSCCALRSSSGLYPRLLPIWHIDRLTPVFEMEETYISERSLLNASPETIQEGKEGAAFSKSPIARITYAPPTAYTETPLPDRPRRKRERVAFRLDSWADWMWDTTANILQLRSTGEGWTAETCSFVFAVLSLLGLVVTLFVHQNKPLPQWPQLITINSIVSLFSLLMRAGVGLVLAEGEFTKSRG